MTKGWNEVVWNEVVMERSDRIPVVHYEDQSVTHPRVQKVHQQHTVTVQKGNRNGRNMK